jgi:hypothetical protein
MTIMSSQITRPGLSSSNEPSNHMTWRNCTAYHAGKAPPSPFKYIHNFVSIVAMEQNLKEKGGTYTARPSRSRRTPYGRSAKPLTEWNAGLLVLALTLHRHISSLSLSPTHTPMLTGLSGLLAHTISSDLGRCLTHTCTLGLVRRTRREEVHALVLSKP